MAKRRPNVIDIGIVLVLLAVIGLVGYKFGVVNRREATSLEEGSKITTYTAFIGEVRMFTVNVLHEGDLIFDEKTGTCIGEIVDVSYVQQRRSVVDARGVAGQVDFPDYYDVTLTIEGAVVEKEEAYYASGVVELKANSEMLVYTKYAKPIIQITGIDM